MILDKIELEMHGPSVNKSFFNKLWIDFNKREQNLISLGTCFQPLTIITKRSILDAAAAVDPPLLFSTYILMSFWKFLNYCVRL